MSNIVTRIILVFVAVPSLYATALLVPFMHYAPVAALIAIFSIGSAWELAAILEPECKLGRRLLAGFVAVSVCVLVWLAGFVPQLDGLLGYLVSIGIVSLAFFVAQAFALAFTASPVAIHAATRSAATMSMYALYPGAMAAAMMVLLAQPNGGKVLVWYSIISFSNDSFAWLVGITLGKRRGIFLTSPNKSLEGFIAGMVGSVASSMLGPILFPSIVPRSWFLLALTGVVCGIAVVAGDLFESALKRSAKVKDSGNSIPGRGGFLDSFDSIAFAAPVFLVFAVLLGIV